MRFATVFTLASGIASGIATTNPPTSYDSYLLNVRLTVPPCYDDCAAQVAEAGGLQGCLATDVKCLCDSPTYVSEATTCIENTCVGADLGEAILVGETVCQEAGATGTGTFSAIGATATPASGSVPATIPGLTTATPTTGSTPATLSGLTKAAAAVHDANVNSFISLAALGLLTLII